jgi:hypothetical protein
MVGLEFFFIYGCPHEEIHQFRDLPLRHQAPQVGVDEVVIAVLSAPELLPASSSIDRLVGGGLLVDFVAMECGAGSNATKNRVAGKDGKARVRSDGTRCAQWRSAL